MPAIGSDAVPQLVPPSKNGPPLASGEVHLWRIDLAPLLDRVPEILPALDDADRQRAGAVFNVERRRRFIAGRFMVRMILARYLGLAPAAIRFAYNPHGKPRLCAGSVLSDLPLRFNFSHSGARTVLALSADMELGVDLEEISQRAAAAYVRFFGLEDRLDPVTDHAWIARNWVRMEAYAKGKGYGMSRGLRHLMEPALAVEADPEGWSVIDLPPWEGCQAALAHQGVLTGIREMCVPDVLSAIVGRPLARIDAKAWVPAHWDE